MIEEQHLSNEVADLFKKFGWYPGRHVEIADLVNPLIQEGFTLNPLAVGLLTSLGRLKVTRPDNFWTYGLTMSFIPDGEYERMIAWESLTKCSLFPVAEYVGYVQTGLWTGSDNRIFFGGIYAMFVLGDNVRDAFDKLFFDSNFDCEEIV